MKEQAILTIFSLIVSLSALAIIGWTTLNGEALHLDGLMLILCCFAAIAIFLPVFLVEMRQGSLSGILGKKKTGDQD